MSSKMTSDQLVESVKRRASIPESQSTYEPSDILAFAGEELSLDIIPAILELHEDYLLYPDDVPIEAGKSDYRIPDRAIGSKLRDVQLVSSNGNIVSEMTRLGAGDIIEGAYNGGNYYLRQFYIKNNKVVLPGNPGTDSGFLRMWYYMTPSSLVLLEDVGVIKDISAPSGGIVTLTLTATPDGFGSLNSLGLTQTYDIYSSTSTNSIINKDMAVVGINTNLNTISFAEGDIPDSLQPGDHVSLAGESAIPQIPSDLHPMLAQTIACRILDAQGDAQGLQTALGKLAKMKVSAGILIDNRVEDAPRKIVNKRSPLMSGVYNRWFKRNR